MPHLTILGIVLAFAFVQLDPPKVLFAVFFIYSMSGPVNWFRERRKASKATSNDSSKESSKDSSADK